MKKDMTLEDTQTIETDTECCPDAKTGDMVELVVKGSVREVTKDGRVLVDVEAVEPAEDMEPEETEDEDEGEDEEKPMAHGKMAGEGITITIGKAPMPPRLLHAIKKKMMGL